MITYFLDWKLPNSIRFFFLPFIDWFSGEGKEKRVEKSFGLLNRFTNNIYIYKYSKTLSNFTISFLPFSDTCLAFVLFDSIVRVCRSVNAGVEHFAQENIISQMWECSLWYYAQQQILTQLAT